MIPTPVFELLVLILSLVWLQVLLAQLGVYSKDGPPRDKDSGRRP